MNTGRIILTGIVLAILYILMETVTNGYILQGMYEQTASVWRSESEIQDLCWMMWLGQAIFAFVFSYIFAGGFERGKSGLGQGFRFGFLVALLLAPAGSLLWYAVLPIPGSLAVAWFVMTFIQMWILGIVAGLIYRH